MMQTTRHYGQWLTALAISGTAVFIFACVAPLTAGAYSIYGNSGGTTSPAGITGGTTAGTGNASGGGWNSLMAPFENFIHSINSIGNVSGPANQPSQSSSKTPPKDITGAGAFASGVQYLFQWFDNWLYGIAGFHISHFFTAILGILSWLLGLVKSGVDWLLGLIP